MVNVSEIAPSPLLAPFVRCYSRIEFDTHGLDLIRPTHAVHEMVVTFHFKAKPARFSNSVLVQSFQNAYGGAIGLFTQDNGDMIFNGHYIFFEIVFKPNGFYKIFKLPPGKATNQMILADEILAIGVRNFYEQLSYACHAKDLTKMCSLADDYLTGFLRRQKRIEYNDPITCVSNLIIKNKGVVNVDKLAYDANMSIRSFERHFIKQVGIPAKLFCNITRFNHALTLKMANPHISWTSIAQDCGYYDQMHLIKDFKKFAANTPSAFIKENSVV